jgi:hypothetical protein
VAAAVRGTADERPVELFLEAVSSERGADAVRGRCTGPDQQVEECRASPLGDLELRLRPSDARRELGV